MITSIRSLREVIDYLEENRKSLVVFDIDMVLTHPKEPAFQLSSINRYREVMDKLTRSLSLYEKDILMNVMITSSPPILVEKGTAKLIEEIQRRGIKAIALTAAFTGPFGSIASMERWRYQNLKNNRIDFSPSFPTPHFVIFDHLTPFRGNFPTFYKGILLANGETNPHSKGETLTAFLKTFSLNPSLILFVDDKIKQLQNVEQALNLLSPSPHFVGFQYEESKFSSSPKVKMKDFKNKWKDLINKMKKLKNKT